MLKKLYKNKKLPTKKNIDSDSKGPKHISSLTIALITTSSTIISGLISTLCMLHAINVQSATNSFNFKDSEYVRRQNIADLIIIEAGESESSLKDKSIDCHSKAVVNKVIELHKVHKQFYHHLYKTVEYMDQYLATDETSTLSDIRLAFRKTLINYEVNDTLFEECSPESEQIFSDDKFRESRNELAHSIWRDSERLKKERDKLKI